MTFCKIVTASVAVILINNVCNSNQQMYAPNGPLPVYSPDSSLYTNPADQYNMAGWAALNDPSVPDSNLFAPAWPSSESENWAFAGVMASPNPGWSDPAVQQDWPIAADAPSIGPLSPWEG